MDRRHLQLTESFIADDLRQMQLAPNYNNWLYSIVKPHLGKRVIEVGAGIGNRQGAPSPTIGGRLRRKGPSRTARLNALREYSTVGTACHRRGSARQGGP